MKKASWRAAVALVLATPGAVAAATATDLYYERSVMVAANARCGLFAPAVGQALAAGQAQARGAALRSGWAERDLDAVQARAAAKAGSVACASPDIALAAGRVRQGYAAYARISRMTYPGDWAGWQADRTPSYAQATWRLRQDVRFGWDRMAFGLVGRGPVKSLLAVAAFADGAQPYAARLVLRDVALTTGPFLDRRLAGAGGRIPLAGRLPPRASDQAFMAEARSPAGDDLKPAGAGAALAFRFPAAASDALARLDPREAVAVEFSFSGRSGDTVRTAWVEVGDFAAGRAFVGP
ncbi:MAG TPA: hypothetical protein VG939_05675 [Caulobacteraceae bacterium]|nr:hypothetical protein [Caulobacteraceae bacterium]